MYLLDANVFIYAQRDYYPPERVPEYWSWLAHQADIENIKVPAPIWDEIKPHDDQLLKWMQQNKEKLILKNDESDPLLSEILEFYAPDLTEDELEQIGADPFLIAAAKFFNAVVVSKEGRKPSKKRANRRIPDICNEIGIQCITDHKLIVKLDFCTQDW